METAMGIASLGRPGELWGLPAQSTKPVIDSYPAIVKIQYQAIFAEVVFHVECGQHESVWHEISSGRLRMAVQSTGPCKSLSPKIYIQETLGVSLGVDPAVVRNRRWRDLRPNASN